MKKLLFIGVVLLALSAFGETYTEFYIIKSDPTNNLNAGSTSDLTPNFVYGGGNWTNTTCTFRVASGNPLTDGVTNGAWASIYTTSGATIATTVGIVSNVTATTITLDTNTVPSTAATPSGTAGATTCKVGGCWAGPNTNQNPSVTFPWAFMAGTMTNGTGRLPCFNFKTSIYSMTNAVTLANAGAYPFRIAGYGTSLRDGIRWTNDGFFSGPSFNVLTISGQNIEMSDFAFMSNGVTGNAVGILVSGGGNVLRSFYISGMAGYGVNVTGGSDIEEFEEQDCNKVGNTGFGGIRLFTPSGKCKNGIIHNNVATAGKGHGLIYGGGRVINCAIYNNNGNAIIFSPPGLSCTLNIESSAIYSNALSGIDFIGTWPTNQAVQMDIENIQFFRNHGMAITNTSTAGITMLGRIANCTFGSGTMANVNGDIVSGITNGVSVIGSLSYTAGLTPWTDPDNGNFTPVNSVASNPDRARGISKFYQATVNSPTNTVSYPDVGAAQAAGTNSTASGGSYTFAQ